jgi:hypothetical protein
VVGDETDAPCEKAVEAPQPAERVGHDRSLTMSTISVKPNATHPPRTPRPPPRE